MLIKTLAGIGLFAAGGAAIGYSQVLCFNGQCAITGTPYGGALFGGMIGLALMSGLNAPSAGYGPEQGGEASEESDAADGPDKKPE